MPAGGFLMRATLALLGCFLLSVVSPAIAQETAPPMLTAEQAREEATLVFARIAEQHPDPFWHTKEEDWRKAYDALIQRTEPVSHVDHYFALAKLMALAFDTHTQIYPEADTLGFQTSYPVRFRLFHEGTYVTAADGPYRAWVGRRVVSIAGKPVEEIVERLATVSFADHEIRKRNWAIEYLLPHPAVYRHFGWMNDDSTVSIVLEGADRKLVSVHLEETVDQGFDTISRSGTNTAYFWPEGWRTLNDLAVAAPPLSRLHLDRNYWFEEVANGEMIYVQLNRPFDTESGERLYDFWLRLFQTISAKTPKYKRLILDVRYNLGGSISYSLPAPYLAHGSYLCCKPGGIVLLAGRETVSAGAVIIGEFERASRPVVIGEPTGSRPNIFYNHNQIPLQHSGLFAEASTARYDATVLTDERVMIAPDVLVPESIADILAGKDAALDAAIALTEEEAEGFYVRGRDYHSWLRPSQDRALPTKN